MMFAIHSIPAAFAGPFFGMGIPELIITLLIIALVVPSIVALYRKGKTRSNSGPSASALSPGAVVPAPSDAPSMGYAVLGFFIPLAGLILYLVWKDQYPLRAKSAGKGALIGFIADLVLPCAIFALIALMSMMSVM
jgi:hypothetical protein